MHSNGRSVTTDLEKANISNNYCFIQAPTDHPVPSNTATALININISEEDVYSVLINFNTTKATGPDNIPRIVLFKCTSVLC